jgi:hypothetical protein
MNIAEQIYLRETRTTHLKDVTYEEFVRNVEVAIDTLAEAVTYMDEAAGRISDAEIAVDKLAHDAKSLDPDMGDEVELYLRQMVELADDADSAYQALDKIHRAFKKLLK